MKFKVDYIPLQGTHVFQIAASKGKEFSEEDCFSTAFNVTENLETLASFFEVSLNALMEHIHGKTKHKELQS